MVDNYNIPSPYICGVTNSTEARYMYFNYAAFFVEYTRL